MHFLDSQVFTMCSLFVPIALPLSHSTYWNSQYCPIPFLLARYDQELSELYRNMDSSDTARPNVEAIKGNIQATYHDSQHHIHYIHWQIHNITVNIQETIHSMEMSYGTTGSLFRSGSRQTFFATQVTRSALELLQISDCWLNEAMEHLKFELIFVFQVCRHLCCFSPQHALLSHILHVQR